PSLRDTGGRPISIATVTKRPNDGLDEVQRRSIAEGDGIADIQIADAGTGGFDPLSFGNNITNGVGELVDACGDGEGARRHGRILPRSGLPGDRSSRARNSYTSPFIVRFK